MPKNNRILHSVKIHNDWVTIHYTGQDGKEEKYSCAKAPFVLLIEQAAKDHLEQVSKRLQT